MINPCLLTALCPCKAVKFLKEEADLLKMLDKIIVCIRWFYVLTD